MNNAQQETGKHQPQGSLGIDAWAPGAVGSIAVAHFGAQPGQIQYPVYAREHMIVGHQIAQRPCEDQLRLALRSAAQHVATTPNARHISESKSGSFFNSPRVHWMRNARSYVSKGQQSMVSAALRQTFIQPDRATASQTLRHVADQLRPKWPRLAAFIDDSEADVLAHMDFPSQHRTKIHSTNPLERLNKEVNRRSDVVGIFPNEGAIIRLIGAVLLEANDEWQLQHRYMQTEAMAELTPPLLDAAASQISTQAA